MNFDGTFSDLKRVPADVSQDSVLGPVLHLLYNNTLKTLNSTIAIFVDDTARLAKAESAIESTIKLPRAVNKVAKLTCKWRMKLNETETFQLNFTNKKIIPYPIYIDCT